MSASPSLSSRRSFSPSGKQKRAKPRGIRPKNPRSPAQSLRFCGGPRPARSGTDFRNRARRKGGRPFRSDDGRRKRRQEPSPARSEEKESAEQEEPSPSEKKETEAVQAPPRPSKKYSPNNPPSLGSGRIKKRCPQRQPEKAASAVKIRKRKKIKINPRRDVCT